MARTDRYSHNSNGKGGDTSDTQQGNKAKAEAAAGKKDPQPKSDGPADSGPPAGESSIFGLHGRERADMLTRHEDEMKMMHGKHLSEHKAMNERQMAEIGPGENAAEGAAKKEEPKKAEVRP
jgi:hypothetical protein